MKLATSTLTNENLENLLEPKETNVFIEISPASHFRPGLFTAFLQIVCTRLRREESIFEINTNLGVKGAELIASNFHEYYHLLSIVLFKNNLIIRDENGFMLNRNFLIANSQLQFDLQEDLYSLTFEDLPYPENSRLSKVQEVRRRVFSDRSRSKTLTGVSFFVPCFDHSRLLRKTSYFYNPEGAMRTKEEVRSWVNKLFRFNNLNIRTGIERNSISNDIAVVIKELFDNTEEWGRTSFDNDRLHMPNLRSCFVNIYLEPRIQKLNFPDSDRTSNYLRSIVKADLSTLRIPNWQIELYQNSKIGFCEISILDIGPGMARRWMKKDYTEFDLRDEKIAVTKCFNKYVTSDYSGKSQVRGRGLSSVIKVIGQNGFIEVRTGRLLVSRNFFRDQLNPVEINEGLDFEFEEQREIEGTRVTILYPFLYNP